MLNSSSETQKVKIRPGELAVAALPLLALLFGLYVAAEVVWASFSLVLLLAAAVLAALFISRLAGVLSSRVGVPPKAATVIVLAAITAALLGFLYIAGSQIAEQFSQLLGYLPRTMENWQKLVNSTPLGSQVSEYIKQGSQEFSPSMVVGNVRGIFSSAVGFFGTLVFFIFVALYLSIDPLTYKRGLLSLLKTPERKRRGEEVLDLLGEQLWHFLLGQMFTMSVMAILTTTGLFFLKIPSFLALGLLAGGLAFIPVVGAALAFLPAFLVGSTQGGNTLLWVCGLYAAVQFLEGNFLTPMIQRKMTSIPPVLLMTAQAVMGLLFGLFGVALAAPAAVMGMLLVDEFYLKDRTESPADRTVALLPDTSEEVLPEQTILKAALPKDPIPGAALPDDRPS